MVLDDRISGFRGNYGVLSKIVYSSERDEKYDERRKAIARSGSGLVRQRGEDDEKRHAHTMRWWQNELIG